MSVSFNIKIPCILPQEELASIFTKIYQVYDGALFAHPSLKLSVRGVKENVKINIYENNFSEINEYAKKLDSIGLECEHGPAFYINYDTILGDIYPTIRTYKRFFWAETEEEVKKLNGELKDVIEFSKLLMKYSNASYFYGGVEAFGDAADLDNEDIALIYGPEKVIVEKVRGFLKNRKIELSEDETRQVIEEASKARINDGECELIYFFEIKAKKTIYDEQGNQLLRVAKTLSKKMKGDKK